ncbi:MAG: hypothetical protein CMH55_07000 [Myxococcales bacterium]|nr:hypothetical protein [Myxococcales bacterium]|tara:strand:- start:69 stop:542 length:474 start_codon:yes stop_codon:yes gene_type:complete
MTTLIFTLILGFFPEPATYLTGRLEILKSHNQNPKAIHLASHSTTQRIDISSPGVLGAWLGLLVHGRSTPRIAEACGVDLTGTVKPRLVDGKVLLDLGVSGWVIDQDTGLPVELTCKGERLRLTDYGQGDLPLLFPERVHLETPKEQRQYRVVKIEF